MPGLAMLPVYWDHFRAHCGGRICRSRMLHLLYRVVVRSGQYVGIPSFIQQVGLGAAELWHTELLVLYS